MRRLESARVATAFFCVAALARAEPTRDASTGRAPSPAEHRVDFRAQQVEIDPDSGALVLNGKAVVRAHRFRLTSREQLTLSRSSRGLHVKGAGRLALCACENPPFAFGFTEADLAPPTDVLLQGATLRLASVPVFYSPFFWLRAPNRAGLVPPSLAYRGEEGVVAGLGFHVPFADDRGISSLRFDLFGYSRGGGRARVDLATLHGRTTLAFDHLEQSGLDLKSSVATWDTAGNSTALRVDWLAGERARTALSRIERAALPSDRVRMAVGHAEDGVIAFELMADAARARPLDAVGIVGPGFLIGRAVALGSSSEAHASLETQTAHISSGALVRGRAEAGVTVGMALGPALVELRARERADVALREQATASELSSDLGSRVGFPLARRYGALVHTVEPVLEAAHFGAFRSEPTSEALLIDDAVPKSSVALLFGVENALGDMNARSAGDLRLGGGLAGPVEDPQGVASGRARADTRYFRVQAEARSLPLERSAELSFRTEVGDRTRLRLGARADARLGDTPLPRRVWEDDAGMVRVSPLDRGGWSAGGRLGVPWGPGFDTELGSDFDLVAGRWLSASGALGYQHPCRCVSLVLMGSRRVGRRSFDAELSIELVP